MSEVTSKYRVTMGSRVEDAIVVHFGRNHNIKFTQCGYGLITLIPTTLDTRKHPKTRFMMMTKQININVKLPDTPLSLQSSKIKNTLVDMKLKERIVHDYFR